VLPTPWGIVAGTHSFGLTENPSRVAASIAADIEDHRHDGLVSEQVWSGEATGLLSR